MNWEQLIWGSLEVGSPGGKRDGGRNVLRERLDRGISSMSWRLVFPKATIQHLGAINSDHSPILLDTQPTDHYLPRPFRFKAAWTRDTKCFGIIAKAWKEEVEGSDFLKFYETTKHSIGIKEVEQRCVWSLPKENKRVISQNPRDTKAGLHEREL